MPLIEHDEEGGRIFFSGSGRTLAEEDEISLLTVGIDIGSSTSHLVFSRIVLERLDARYVVAERESFYQSDILLTPYAGEETIDAEALDAFFALQYRQAGVDPEEIDTGAVILTGVAVERRNARRIGELFASQAGKLVAVSAGDSLEAIMAAHGSGAVARSIRDSAVIMNVDVGGGTSKIAVCADGRVVALTAVDVGARLVCRDAFGRVLRIEEAGRAFAQELGIELDAGALLSPELAHALAARMAERLFDAMRGAAPIAGGRSLLRLDPLRYRGRIDQVSFSGGVSEYLYGRQRDAFGDLGPLLAAELRARLAAFGPRLVPPTEGIRATVIGTAQYTIQVSGSTIFVSPPDTLPLRNVPVVAPELPLAADVIDPEAVAIAVINALKHLDLAGGERAVALFVPWQGSATFARLDSFCRGAIAGLSPVLARGHPLIFVGSGDVGGLIGVHCRHEMRITNPIVSVDGLELKEFDYIDIGAMIENAGAVPVVIKSLIFPGADTRSPVARP